MNHKAPIRNNKLIREAYEAGRRETLNLSEASMNDPYHPIYGNLNPSGGLPYDQGGHLFHTPGSYVDDIANYPSILQNMINNPDAPADVVDTAKKELVRVLNDAGVSFQMPDDWYPDDMVDDVVDDVPTTPNTTVKPGYGRLTRLGRALGGGLAGIAGELGLAGIANWGAGGSGNPFDDAPGEEETIDNFITASQGLPAVDPVNYGGLGRGDANMIRYNAESGQAWMFWNGAWQEIPITDPNHPDYDGGAAGGP